MRLRLLNKVCLGDQMDRGRKRNVEAGHRALDGQTEARIVEQARHVDLYVSEVYRKHQIAPTKF